MTCTGVTNRCGMLSHIIQNAVRLLVLSKSSAEATQKYHLFVQLPFKDHCAMRNCNYHVDVQTRVCPLLHTEVLEVLKVLV